MSKELIQALRKTKLDGICGTYYGGNDEGGIDHVKAFVLKPKFSIEEWIAGGDLNFHEASGSGTTTVWYQVTLDPSVNAWGPDRHVEIFADNHKDEFKQAGIPTTWNLYEMFVEPFDAIISEKYGSFAGEFHCQGAFHATRDGHFVIKGLESVEQWEDITLAEEVFNLDLLPSIHSLDKIGDSK